MILFRLTIAMDQAAILNVGAASMSTDAPILVTGAAGRVGAVGRDVVEILRRRSLPVRALVRREDERAEALRAIGAEVVVGDLTRAADVARALAGCRRMYFGMSVSAPYLEATVTAAAVARAARRSGGVRQHLPDDRVADEPDRDDRLSSAASALAWRAGVELVGIARGACPGHGLPPEPLLLGLGRRIDRRDATIRLPFGTGRTSPVDVRDVAEVIAAVLASPAAHIGKVYELDRTAVSGHACRGGGILRRPWSNHYLC